MFSQINTVILKAAWWQQGEVSSVLSVALTKKILDKMHHKQSGCHFDMHLSTFNGALVSSNLGLIIAKQ